MAALKFFYRLAKLRARYFFTKDPWVAEEIVGLLKERAEELEGRDEHFKAAKTYGKAAEYTSSGIVAAQFMLKEAEQLSESAKEHRRSGDDYLEKASANPAQPNYVVAGDVVYVWPSYADKAGVEFKSAGEQSLASAKIRAICSSYSFAAAEYEEAAKDYGKLKEIYDEGGEHRAGVRYGCLSMMAGQVAWDILKLK